jgi:hypothetical protein
VLEALARPGLLPSPQGAQKAWVELLNEARDLHLGKVEVKELHAVRWEGLKLKYRAKGLEDRAPFGKHPLVRRNAALWWEFLGKEERVEVGGVVRALGLSKLCDAKLHHMLKKLGATMFKHHEDLPFGSTWDRWVGLDTWFGASTPLEPGADEDIEADLHSWVNPGSGHPQWDRRRGMIERGHALLRLKAPLVFKQPGWDIDGFLLQPSKWMANGAATSGSVDGTRKTKVSMLIARGRDGVRSLLFDRAPLLNRAYIKSERKKNRGTIAVEDSLWLQMVFCLWDINEAISAALPTPLKGGVPLRTWVTWCTKIQAGGVGMPIDQSGFDHVPTISEVVAIVRYFLEQAALRPGWSAEQAYVAELIVQRLEEGGRLEYTRRDGRVTSIPVRHGILSGWFLTASVDTWLNVCEWCALSEEAGVPINLDPEETSFMGDDVNKCGGSFGLNTAIAERYMDTLDVHPTKFWIRKDRGEFLRKTYGWDRRHNRPMRRSYLGRLVPSLLYAQRWSEGVQSARATAKQWSAVASLAGDRSVVYSHMVRDLTGYLGCSRALVEQWCRTPAPYGGLGFLPVDHSPWVALREKKMGIAKNEYELGLPASKFEDLTSKAKLDVLKMGSWFKSQGTPGTPADIMSTLVGSLHLKKVKEPDREQLLPCARPSCSSYNMGRCVVPRPPRFVGDPYLVQEVVRSAAREGSDEQLRQLIVATDWHIVVSLRRRWSRNAWMAWLMDELPQPSFAHFGFADDVCGHYRQELLVPSGKVNLERFTMMAAAAGYRGRRVLFEDHRLHSMCA